MEIVMTNKDQRSAIEIAEGHWTNILQSAGIESSLLTRKESPCPICHGSTRFIYYDKDEKGLPKEYRTNPKGLSFCNHCGGRSGIQLLMDYKGCDFKTACEFIENWYYGHPVEPTRSTYSPPVESQQSIEARIKKARSKHQSIWRAGKPVTEGDPVFKYLCNRIPGFHAGLLSPMIKYHPQLEYWVEEKGSYSLLGKFPGMIAFVTAPDGTCQDIHRTFLTPDGFKADVPCPKKTVASTGVFGGAIQLVRPTGNVLAVSEGIETAYAVELFKKLPCWALLNSYNMSKFEVPNNVEFLHIFEDNDVPDARGVRVGQKAAQALQERAIQKGIKVKRHSTVKPGTDFLDLLIKLHTKNLVAA